MGLWCKSNKKCGFKKPNKCKKYYYNCNNSSCGNNNNSNITPCSGKKPVSSTNHYKSYTCLDGKDYFVVNENFYDNYYEKCNHYYITDCNHITDHYYEYNVYHYDTKDTHDEKYVCKDVDKIDPDNNCVEKNNACSEKENCDCHCGCNCDYCKKHRENSSC